VQTVESALGLDVDYAMLNKVYRANPEGQKHYTFLHDGKRVP